MNDSLLNDRPQNTAVMIARSKRLYLKNRKQCDKVYIICGEFEKIILGDSLGPIIGPILFNDLVSNFIFDIKKTSAHNFVHDSALTHFAHTLEDQMQNQKRWLDGFHEIKWSSL